MADENPRELLKTRLKDLDSNALHKLMVAAYDRWCWESGSEMDKDWYEVAEEILKERGLAVNFDPDNGGGFSNVGVFSNQPQHITVNADTFKFGSPGSGVENVVFEHDGGFLELGWDLKMALIKFLVDEIMFGNTRNNSGKSLKDVVEEAVANKVTIDDWMLRSAFDRFADEREAIKKAQEEAQG